MPYGAASSTLLVLLDGLEPFLTDEVPLLLGTSLLEAEDWLAGVGRVGIDVTDL